MGQLQINEKCIELPLLAVKLLEAKFGSLRLEQHVRLDFLVSDRTQTFSHLRHCTEIKRSHAGNYIKL